jgi:hypothetical protein
MADPLLYLSISDPPDDCISLIEPASPNREEAASLILIHDGGGTTVSYYFLGSLDRAVYGIRNPRFYSGEVWEHGLLEMGRVYADLVRSAVPSGRILLGGKVHEYRNRRG